MKHSILAAAMLLVLSLSIAGAVVDSASIQYYVDIYNNRVDNAPDILKGLLGNERININITKNDGSILVTGFEMENARINRVVDGGVNDPTITVVTTEDAIDNIRSSDNPISTFQTERERGQVVIKGNSLTTRVKLDAILSSTSVLQFFYNIFFGKQA